MENSRFMNFMLHSWVRYERFKGAAAIAAILLNLILLVFKLVFCGIILVVTAPHLAANHLLNQPKTVMQRVGYVLMVALSLVIDIPLLLVCVVGFLTAIELFTASQFLAAVICVLLSCGLAVLERHLLGTLFFKENVVASEDAYGTEPGYF